MSDKFDPRDHAQTGQWDNRIGDFQKEWDKKESIPAKAVEKGSPYGGYPEPEKEPSVNPDTMSIEHLRRTEAVTEEKRNSLRLGGRQPGDNS